VIDREVTRAVEGWLRIGDAAAGQEPIEGRCDRCRRLAYLSRQDGKRLCARCCLEGPAEEP
jgi:hypothetical protein